MMMTETICQVNNKQQSLTLFIPHSTRTELCHFVVNGSLHEGRTLHVGLDSLESLEPALELL